MDATWTHSAVMQMRNNLRTPWMSRRTCSTYAHSSESREREGDRLVILWPVATAR